MAVATCALAAAACQRGPDSKPMLAMQVTQATEATAGAVPNPAMTAPDETAWNVFIGAVRPSNSAPTFFGWPNDTQTFAPPVNGKLMMSADLKAAASLHAPVIPSVRAQLRGAGGGPGGHGLSAAAGASGDGPPNPRPPGVGSGCNNTADPVRFEPGCDSATLEDVRRNPVTHDYIVANHLNSRSGLIRAYKTNFIVNLPADSVEVKTNWVPVSLLPKYYPGVAQSDFVLGYFVVNGRAQQFAMISMHATSKQVPNWTWATFEHQANRGRCDFIGCHDVFGATNANVAPVDKQGQEQGTVYANCTKSPALLAAFAAAGVSPVFRNYCLKGSQTDFTDNNGLAVRLGNSVTENGFVPQASCMTCHGEANFTGAGTGTSQFGFFNGNGQIGAINPLLVGYWKMAGTPPSYTPYQNMPGLVRNAASADFVWAIPFCAYDDVTNPLKPKARC
jgi:hypothetical protein